MALNPELNEREQLILQAVVHSYITTAEPVGSRTVVKRFQLDISPATVRNVMADLEEQGYLQQLHTSSGRVPTDKGYRYYVDYLMQVQELTLAERAQIEQELEAKLNDVDDVLKQTSHLLALTSHQAGIAEVPDQGRAELRHLELMPIAPDRLAILVVDNYGRVRSMVVQVEVPLTPDDVVVLNNFLNDHLRSVRVDNITSAVEQKLRTFLDEQRQLAERALSVLRLMPGPVPTQLFLDGTKQLFEQPEFHDMDQAREVFGLLEEQDRLVGILRAAAMGDSDTRIIVIGEEGRETGLKGMSIIASPYEVEGRPVGMIGVLGPRRMPYSKLTAIVDYTAKLVSKMLPSFGK